MSNRTLLSITGLAVALVGSVFVFAQLRPDLVLADTTPAGGDMGAHVWGPTFLRDELLPNFRLNGWTPDWYAGFPAYQYYMVVPALAILAVNAGITPWLGIPLALLAVEGGRRAVAARREHRLLFTVLTALVVILLVPLPYGISFKLVAVSGLVAMPVAAWWMARQTTRDALVPPAIALAVLVFLFDTNFTIYGGNIASTLAGEFAFAMSLCLTFVAIGWAFRGMDEQRHRASAAVLIALVALCHIIPLFFAVVALALVVVLPERGSRRHPFLFGVLLALVPIGFADRYAGLSTEAFTVLAVLFGFAAMVVLEPAIRRRAEWLVVTGPVAALLAAFWLVPFVGRSELFNDMGWERLDEVGDAMLTTPMRVALPVALLGSAMAFARRDRIGMLFSATALISASAVANLGESKLWNARLLPFFYLSVYVLAALGLAAVARFAAVAVSERYDRPDVRVLYGSMVGGLVLALVVVGMPLRVLPGGSTDDAGTYRWLGVEGGDRSFVGSWAAWNFSGYERKSSYAEYSSVVDAMARVGEEQGCGRAMWEYDKDLDRYGTPMALMLLPHWTDGCISSMEGLYFESSATTPFHFLNQSALSDAPSSAQRDLPYRGFDIDRGISQLQVMGVRYYMAQSDRAIAAARNQANLVEIAEAPPFVIFRVEGSELVEALDVEPVVASGRDDEPIEGGGGEVLENRFELGWLGEAVTFYNDPRPFRTLPAEDGPAGWERVTSLLPSDGRSVEPATVYDIAVDTDRVDFRVDRVGTPVLVKISYFPNWQADGADGPWRIGPNLMVVVPTETEVTLSYGRSSLDWLGILLTLVAIGATIGLARVDARRPRSAPDDVSVPPPDHAAAPPSVDPDVPRRAPEPSPV